MKKLLSYIIIISCSIAYAYADEPSQNFSPKRTKSEIIQSERVSYVSDERNAAVQKTADTIVLEPHDAKAAPAPKWVIPIKIPQAKQRDISVLNIRYQGKSISGRLSLSDCITIAIQNHLPLQIAMKNVQLGEMRVWEARRNMLPSVSIKWEESEGRVNSRAYTGKKQSIEGQQPIFRGGELFFTMKQAETNLKIVKQESERIKNDLTLQVKKAYYTLEKSEQNLHIQSDLKREVNAIYDMATKGFESNVVPKIDYYNVTSQKSQVDYQYISAEGDTKVAALILKQAMSVDPASDIAIRNTLSFKKIAINPDEVWNAAFSHRPEVKINYLMIEYYNYERSIARAKGWPKVDLMGSWGLAKEEYASQDQDPNPPNYDTDRKMEQQWYAGFKMSMPFWGSTAEYSFTREQWQPVVSAYQGTEAKTSAVKVGILDNLKYFSDRHSAEIDYDRARQEFTKIKQDLTLEVQEQCFSYEKALIQLDTAISKMRYQEKELELNRMKRGLDELPDANVVESMIKLAQEKFGHAQALADCNIAVAAINKAIGVSDYFKSEETETNPNR